MENEDKDLDEGRLDEALDHDDDELDGESTTNDEDKRLKQGDEVVTIEGEISPEDDELEKRRIARREERKARKEAAREKEAKLRRELASERNARLELENRLSIIERRSTGGELAQLDANLKNTAQAYNFHKEQLQQATTQGNGVVAAEATEKMILAKQRLDQLNNIKTAYQQRQSTPQPLDNRVINNANEFMKRNSWYVHGGTDQDSQTMLSLDNRLAAEGWNPATPEYWEELEDRAKKHLPHRYNRVNVTNNDLRQGKPKSVVTGSGNEASANSVPKGQFVLSAARVQALKDAGMWNDEKKRAEMIKSFRDYDRNAKNKE